MDKLEELVKHLSTKGNLLEKNTIKSIEYQNLEKNDYKNDLDQFRYLLFHDKDEINLPSNIVKDNQCLKGRYYHNNKNYYYYYYFLTGKNLNRDVNYPFKKCLAISHFYNEEDILYQNVTYMLNQGIDIYLIDNWSDDNSFKIAKQLKDEYPDRIFLDQFPKEKSNDWELEKQLLLTEKIALEMKQYDWILHHDIDEFIHSPFSELTLQESISFIDHLGYNCIEKTILDFSYKPDQTDFSNPFENNKCFVLGIRPRFIPQIKIWKNIGPVNIHSTGGHFPQFLQNRNHCYEISFWVKHYQYRNPTQLKEKLAKRIPRVQKEKNKNGWHLHLKNTTDITKIYNQQKLIMFDNKTSLYDYFLPIFFKIANP